MLQNPVGERPQQACVVAQPRLYELLDPPYRQVFAFARTAVIDSVSGGYRELLQQRREKLYTNQCYFRPFRAS